MQWFSTAFPVVDQLESNLSSLYITSKDSFPEKNRPLENRITQV